MYSTDSNGVISKINAFIKHSLDITDSVFFFIRSFNTMPRLNIADRYSQGLIYYELRILMKSDGGGDHVALTRALEF